MANNPTELHRKVEQFKGDVEIAHLIVHGDEYTVVQTEGGPVKSFAKLMRDIEPTLDSLMPELDKKLDKDKVGVALGVAPLDSDELVPRKHIPVGAGDLRVKTQGVQAETVIDSIASRSYSMVKWVLHVNGVGINARNRVVMEVTAIHNGSDTIDADFVDYSTYAKLKTAPFQDLAVSVTLNDLPGDERRLELRLASPQIVVDACVIRESVIEIEPTVFPPIVNDGIVIIVDNNPPVDPDNGINIVII